MSALDRASALQRLAAEEFDVLVVGAGMTGGGIALDAAARGLSVALIDKEDFASGTSSKSSKLVHGGLRYLQQREFRLVYENLYERQRLLENAPHLVTALPFLIPLFGKDGIVSKTVARSYATVLWMYDATGGIRIGHRHKRINAEESHSHLPTLRTDRLVAGFLYYDARGDDARIALTLARSAADRGGVVANYVKASSFLTTNGKVTGATVQPCGPNDHDAAPIDVRAKVVVNAAGVWADEVRGLEANQDRPSIKPAKGVHISVPYDRLPCDIASVIPVIKDKRSIFVVPWPEANFVYLGTTDTSYEGDLDTPRCTPEDVDYLLSAVNAVTTSNLTTADVTGVWAGLRPLLQPEGDRHVSERTADLSRRHKVATTTSGVVTVTGGKWTTYRKMAEDAVDVVVGHLGRKLNCPTKKLPLHGAPSSKQGLAAIAGVDRATATHLAQRYGLDASEVFEDADHKMRKPLIESLPYLRAEAIYAVTHEMAQNLDDVLLRRMRAGIQDAYGTIDAAPKTAKLIGPLLGWDADRQAAEVANFVALLHEELTAAGLPTTKEA